MEKVLEIKDLNKLYKNKRGIQGISFDVFKGDIFGFLGPNGAGKTTTMKIVTGLCRADSGEVKILGFDIQNQFEKAMEKVGCIIETSEAYEYLSAEQNLKMIARLYENIDGERIDEVLKIVGLEKYKSENVGNFSLGMKQRLGLASAILSRPEMVILDEPANGLDIEGMYDIRNIIIKLASEHRITFLISSHLIHEMEMTCNRVGIINNGKMLRTGLVKDILNEYSSLEDFFIKQVREEGGCSNEGFICEYNK